MPDPCQNRAARGGHWGYSRVVVTGSDLAFGWQANWPNNPDKEEVLMISPPGARTEGKRGGQVHCPALFRPNDRTTIHFVCRDESDFRMGSGRSRQDLRVRGELVRRESRVEND